MRRRLWAMLSTIFLLCITQATVSAQTYNSILSATDPTSYPLAVNVAGPPNTFRWDLSGLLGTDTITISATGVADLEVNNQPAPYNSVNPLGLNAGDPNAAPGAEVGTFPAPAAGGSIGAPNGPNSVTSADTRYTSDWRYGSLLASTNGPTGDFFAVFPRNTYAAIAANGTAGPYANVFTLDQLFGGTGAYAAAAGNQFVAFTLADVFYTNNNGAYLISGTINAVPEMNASSAAAAIGLSFCLLPLLADRRRKSNVAVSC